jgi:pimeloyl-ACP methyl ester carboxylesterase
VPAVPLSAILLNGFFVLFAAFWLVVIVAWFWYVPRIVKLFGAAPLPRTGGYAPLPHGVPVRFPMDDGTILSGTHLPCGARQPRGLILFCHGLAENRWAVVPFAKTLLERGFDIVTFDFRGHGESESPDMCRPTPWLTHRELRDVCSVVQQVRDRFTAATSGIALIGMSRGANAALCAAAKSSFVRAVVADGAFPLDALQRHYMRRFLRIYFRFPWLDRRLPDICLVSFCKWAQLLYRLKYGTALVKVERLARRVTPAVLMIHGERDSFVPLPLGHALYRKLPGLRRFWLVRGVKHNGAVVCPETRYHQRVARFLLKAFPSVSAADGAIRHGDRQRPELTVIVPPGSTWQSEPNSRRRHAPPPAVDSPARDGRRAA